MRQSDSILAVTGLSKRFPGVQALDNVEFDIRGGEIHGLIGENGAGKSTFIKIIGGAYHADAGEMLFAEAPYAPSNPESALKSGIAIVHQELSLCENMSIAENLLINRHPRRGPFIDRRELARVTREYLAKFGIRVSPNDRVDRLPLAVKEQVEILRALSYRPKLLILDEATGPLSRPQADRLFELLKELQGQGVSILYISHNIPEVLQICDRISVFRDGRFVQTLMAEGSSEEQLSNLMVGRRLGDMFPPREERPSESETVLEVRGLSSGDRFRDVSFRLRQGEILGVAGLVGSGRTDVAMALFGARELTAGEILLSGAALRFRTPRDAIRHGIAYLSEDRRLLGLFLSFSISENLLSVNLRRFAKRWLVDREGLDRDTRRYMDTLDIKASSPRQRVGELSGGNQQKTMFAKWVSVQPRVLIIDEPTRGVDVGAKKAIHELLRGLARQGIAVLMISSELPEVLGMSDRIMIMDSGRVVQVLPIDETVTEEYVMNAIVNSRRKGRTGEDQ